MLGFTNALQKNIKEFSVTITEKTDEISLIKGAHPYNNFIVTTELGEGASTGLGSDPVFAYLSKDFCIGVYRNIKSGNVYYPLPISRGGGFYGFNLIVDRNWYNALLYGTLCVNKDGITIKLQEQKGTYDYEYHTYPIKLNIIAF